MPFGHSPTPLTFDALCASYLQDEAHLARQLADQAQLDQDARKQIQATAKTLTQGLLMDAQRPSVVDAFLSEYTLGSEEGILLMRLAESLIRTPDAATARRLLRDKLLAGNWSTHFGTKSSLVKLGTLGLLTAKVWARLSGGPGSFIFLKIII